MPETQLAHVELEAAIATLKIGLAIIGGLLTLIFGLVAAMWRTMNHRLDDIARDVKDFSGHSARLDHVEEEILRIRENLHDLRDSTNTIGLKLEVLVARMNERGKHD
jgi:hypothetical protein